MVSDATARDVHGQEDADSDDHEDREPVPGPLAVPFGPTCTIQAQAVRYGHHHAGSNDADEHPLTERGVEPRSE